jgi:hypothetical protein
LSKSAALLSEKCADDNDLGSGEAGIALHKAMTLRAFAAVRNMVGCVFGYDSRGKQRMEKRDTNHLAAVMIDQNFPQPVFSITPNPARSFFGPIQTYPISSQSSFWE